MRHVNPPFICNHQGHDTPPAYSNSTNTNSLGHTPTLSPAKLKIVLNLSTKKQTSSAIRQHFNSYHKPPKQENKNVCALKSTKRKETKEYQRVNKLGLQSFWNTDLNMGLKIIYLATTHSSTVHHMTTFRLLVYPFITWLPFRLPFINLSTSFNHLTQSKSSHYQDTRTYINNSNIKDKRKGKILTNNQKLWQGYPVRLLDSQ